MFNFSYIPQPPLMPTSSSIQRRESLSTNPCTPTTSDWYAYSNLNADSACSSSMMSTSSSIGVVASTAANQRMLSFKIYPKKTSNCLSSCNYYENSNDVFQQRQQQQRPQSRPLKFQTFTNNSNLLTRKSSLHSLNANNPLKPLSSNIPAPTSMSTTTTPNFSSLRHSKTSAFKLVKHPSISENSPADFTPSRKHVPATVRRKFSANNVDKKSPLPKASQENQTYDNNTTSNDVVITPSTKENLNTQEQQQRQGSFKLFFKQNNPFEGLFGGKLSFKKDEPLYDNRKFTGVDDLIDEKLKNISLLKRKKNEEYIILNDDNDNWKLIRDKFGMIGYAPSTYLQEINDVDHHLKDEDQEWFHENLTRMQAYLLLTESNSQNGTYLIRNNTSDKGKYTLCLYKNGKVYNYKIQATSDCVFITPKSKFTSLSGLVEFYKQHTSGLVCQLKHALARKTLNEIKDDVKDKEKFQIDRKDLEFLEKIGSGQFGIVLKAEYKSTKTVAVKKMKPGSLDDEINFNKEAEFMMKLQNLQDLQHRNVVQFYGISRDTDETVLIITEYVKYGSLASYLSKNKDKIIKSKNRVLRLLNICIDVCDGMAYLESKHIIHRDLATRNCLVGDNEVVKVADFGLARFTDDHYIANPESQFPVKWSAPEVIKYRSYSNRSDVWSFSCLMYEVFSMGKMPYGSSTSNSLAAKQIIAGIIPERPQYCPYSIYDNIMINAWDKDASNRPSFKQLFKTLSDLVN